jgi:hypothetical protein
MITGSSGQLGGLARTNWAERLAVVSQPRFVQLQNQAQGLLTLQDVDRMLLELSYMPRTPEANVLADDLLDRRNALEPESAVA